MEGMIRWQWFSITLVLLGLQQFDLISISAVEGQSDDPFIYGLCNVNKYSNGSQYESDVSTVLQYLVISAAPAGGFTTYSYGGVHGLLQCRGDVSQQECQNCSVTASQLAYQYCPNAIGARIQLDFCFIRYENYTFASVLDTTVASSVVNVKNSTDIQGFNETLGGLVEVLARAAPLRILAEENAFAIGSAVVIYNHSVIIYGFESCFTSLSVTDCHACLEEAIAAMNQCCSSQVGARLYLGSCSLRYEIYRFF